MISAGIDIGSNSILMLLAKVDEGLIVEEVQDEIRIPRLGAGVDASGTINVEAIDRAASVLSEYRQIIASHDVSFVRAAAASAVRVSRNQQDVLVALENALGYPIRVLTGSEEARITFQGVVGALAKGTVGVIDIGGGSTEISFGEKGQFASGSSIEVGCVRLHERFYSKYSGFAENRSEVGEVIAGKLKNVTSPPSQLDTVLGVSGTPTALAMICKGLKEYDASVINGTVLTLDDISELVDSLTDPRLEGFPRMDGIPRSRAEILPSGALILLNVMELWGMPEVVVSTRGLRHGLASNVGGGQPEGIST